MGHFLNFFKPVRNLPAEELKKWRDERDPGDHIVLDVRTPGEYEKGHIPGAVFIPLSQLEARIDELDRTLPVVAYCKVGGRSRSAAALLNTMGFGETYTIPGGIMAWKGLVAQGPPESGMADFDPGLSPADLAAAAWRLECGSSRFYAELISSADAPEFKDLLRTLAAAEERHKNGLSSLYQDMGGDIRTLTEDPEYCDVMEGGVSVAEGLRWARGQSMEDIIEFLMGLETNALDLYLKVLGRVDDPKGKKVFAHLADEEREHLRRLEDLAGAQR